MMNSFRLLVVQQLTHLKIAFRKKALCIGVRQLRVSLLRASMISVIPLIVRWVLETMLCNQTSHDTFTPLGYWNPCTSKWLGTKPLSCWFKLSLRAPVS